MELSSLQAPAGASAASSLTRDPVYDVPEAGGEQAGQLQGPGLTVSLRERLLLTQPVWLQLRANAAAALHVLQREPPGTFLVRKSNTRQCKALCVRLPEASGASFVSSHDIRETPEAVSLEGSELSFPDLIQLISSYCHRRDVLLLPLQLPRAIRRAGSRKELEAISHLGMEFWSSSLNSQARWASAEAPALPRLKPRAPEELDQGSGGALCFFNPLFPGDLGPAKREKFKRSFKVRVSTETSGPLSPPAVPPPPVPLPPGGPPGPPQARPPPRPLRRESSGGYRVPGGAGPGPGPPPLPSLPSLRDVDSGSPSSSEEEGGARPGSPASSPPRRGRRRRVLRSVSDAFCSLLAPERQVARAVAEMARDRRTAPGRLVQDLLTRVRAGPEPQELPTVREGLSRARAVLVAELARDKLLPAEQLEAAVEKSLQRCVLKPLRPLLLARLRLRLARDGSWGRLAEGLRRARAGGPEVWGGRLPPPAELERVRQKLLKLLRGYSPTAKATRLLQACKLLAEALRSWAGDAAGADEFLPLLSAVLAQCDLPDLLPETEYLAELLDPSLLTGEAGYCLTSLAAGLALLGDLSQAGPPPRSPSQELRRALSLWEQRRLPPTRGCQDPVHGCTSKTLALPPGSSAASLARLCAAKFRVAKPEAFGLFLHGEDGSRLLAPDARPLGLGPGYLLYGPLGGAPEAELGGGAEGPLPSQPPSAPPETQ
ncbi:ras and Rab interactor 1 isoform X2 [Monodelphis domestica]|uniref:ras and Rab interactor 1 isoform X2 n=1 Tax=Monodelphis domestica TaxID=13616 RepID=UPI0024E20022|nr:ras and Rab interactor 1 isoform X2 [Monodelphis domestica]